MRDWRQTSDYDFAEGLNREQWAWEFLRRNAGYRQEYARFIETWMALEAEYGSPPNRDFARWKDDPRAYVKVDAEGGALDCRVDGDKVLIECHLGAQWGFHKFPVDPADNDPVGEGRLSWRPSPLESTLLNKGCAEWLDADPAHVALGFDLGMPLREQIEAAKRQLQMEQRARGRAGSLIPKTVAGMRDQWTLCVRLLDAEAEGAAEAELLQVLFAGDKAVFDAMRTMATVLVDGDYLEILRLPEK